MPTASMRTSASPGPGPSRSISRTTSGAPGASNSAARTRIAVGLPVVVRASPRFPRTGAISHSHVSA